MRLRSSPHCFRLNFRIQQLSPYFNALDPGRTGDVEVIVNRVKQQGGKCVQSRRIAGKRPAHVVRGENVIFYYSCLPFLYLLCFCSRINWK